MKEITNIISVLFPLLSASVCIVEAPGDIGIDVCSSAVNKRYNYFVVEVHTTKVWSFSKGNL